jgi:hypothetical protein
MTTSDEERRRAMMVEAERSVASMRRFRAVAIGMKLGAIASVFASLVLPRTLGTWPIVITGALIGGALGFVLSGGDH